MLHVNFQRDSCRDRTFFVATIQPRVMHDPKAAGEASLSIGKAYRGGTKPMSLEREIGPTVRSRENIRTLRFDECREEILARGRDKQGVWQSDRGDPYFGEIEL